MPAGEDNGNVAQSPAVAFGQVEGVGMTGYAQLDNGLWSNEKMRRIAERHPREFALWVFSISFCSDKLTDGMLTQYAIRKILCVKSAQERRMIELNLWEKRGDDVYVHDYLKMQNSRQDIENSRAANARRQAEWRGRHRGSGNDGNALRDVSHNALRNADVTQANTNTNTNKEREEKDSTLSQADVVGWEPKREHFASARDLSERGYPLVDVTDLGTEFKLSLQAKGVDHYGYRNLDAAFSQWINKRAKSLRDSRQVPGFAPLTGIPAPAKMCHHTWKCRHVLDLLHREEATAGPDLLAQRAAELLNAGKTPEEALTVLGLAMDETEAVA